MEEIAVVEADVARLKQKVAELHIQLNQQRQQQHGMSLTDSSERQQRVKSLQAQQYDFEDCCYFFLIQNFPHSAC